MPPAKLAGRPRIVNKLKKGKAVAVSSKPKQDKKSKSADNKALSPVSSLSSLTQGVNSILKSEENRVSQNKTKKLLIRKRLAKFSNRQTVSKHRGRKITSQGSLKFPLQSISNQAPNSSEAMWQPIVVLEKLEQNEINKFFLSKMKEQKPNGYDLLQTVGLMRINNERGQSVSPRTRRQSKPCSEKMQELAAALKIANDAILEMNLCELPTEISETIKHASPLTPVRISPKVKTVSPKLTPQRKKAELSSPENCNKLEFNKEILQPNVKKVLNFEMVHESNMRENNSDCIISDDVECTDLESESQMSCQPSVEHGIKRRYDYNEQLRTKKEKMDLPLSSEHLEPVVEYSSINVSENCSQVSQETKTVNARSREVLQSVAKSSTLSDASSTKVQTDRCDDTKWNRVGMMKLNKKVRELEKSLYSLQANVNSLNYTVKNKQGQIRALENRLKYYESSKLHAILRDVIADAEACDMGHKAEYSAGFVINLLFAYDQMVIQRRQSVAGEGSMH